MDYARVIRVEIDPASIAAGSHAEPVQGFLHAELSELEQAVGTDGWGLQMFALPSWFNRAKAAVVHPMPPMSADAQFHAKVEADMAQMIILLNSMATMMAAGPPPQTAKGLPPAPAPAKIAGDVFYLVRSDS